MRASAGPASCRRPALVESSSVAPYFAGDLDRQPKLRPLLILGQDIALLGRRETALRRQRELFERRELRGFVETPLDVVLLFQRTGLRGDDADHDNLVALRQEAQR